MKKLLTITALLFSLTSFGQRWNHNDGKKTMLDQWNDERGSTKQIWLGINQIAVIKSSGNDTLKILTQEIVDNNHLFKYIKVGDKVFKEVEEQSNFGYFGSIGFAQPLVLNNNGYYAIAAPARTPIIDTVEWISPLKRGDTTSYTTPKIICRRIIDSLYYKTPKPIKNNTKKINKKQ